MLRFLLTRLAQLVAVLLVVTMAAFMALNLLGDPLFNLFGPNIDNPSYAADVAAAEADYHLDEPLPARYARWVGDMLTGDFGRSYAGRTEVSTILADKLPVTLLLVVMAQIMALIIALPWAVYSAYRANHRLDKISTGFSFAAIGIPNFALGVIVAYVLIIRLGWFEYGYDDDSVVSRMRSLFPAALTLAIGLAAAYQRLLRTDLIATLQEDFILMAKAKGMPTNRILWRHALRSSLFSIVTVFALNTGALIGGSLVVEQIFSIPGLGFTLAESIIRDDYPVVLASVVVIATAFVILNMIVDITYSFLDPRIRRG